MQDMDAGPASRRDAPFAVVSGDGDGSSARRAATRATCGGARSSRISKVAAATMVAMTCLAGGEAFSTAPVLGFRHGGGGRGAMTSERCVACLLCRLDPDKFRVAENMYVFAPNPTRGRVVFRKGPSWHSNNWCLPLVLVHFGFLSSRRTRFLMACFVVVFGKLNSVRFPRCAVHKWRRRCLRRPAKRPI